MQFAIVSCYNLLGSLAYSKYLTSIKREERAWGANRLLLDSLNTWRLASYMDGCDRKSREVQWPHN